jgi:polysaccharide pyruvyl transferase WcaK-like protein
MKSDHPRITLLGSNSGKNLGDAAILASIIDILSKEIPDTEFFVPTTNPAFIKKHYLQKYNIKPVNVMPWTGSIRLAGIPTLRCMAKSDLALICDGIIFGKKLFNPAFNFLITLIFLLPWAKMCGCKLVCYSCGIGPFPGFWSKIFARWTINACDLVIFREEDSKRLAEELGVKKEIQITGDAAFLNQVASEERALEICKSEGINLSQPLLGINVTKYVDSWLSESEQVSDKSVFLLELARGINGAKDSLTDPFLPLIFSTHPMDEPFCFELADYVNGKVIHNSTYLSHDIQAVMRKCSLFLGMRFHSLVLASAVECPIIGLIYAPKVRGFMRLLDCEDLGLELSELSSDKLTDKILAAWKDRQNLQQKQKAVVDELKAGSRQAAVTLREKYFLEKTTLTPGKAA